MSDIFSREVRSHIMSKIKGKDSLIELSIRKELWRLGYRYRKHYGKPKIDIAFPKKKIAVFIDSCFWHACPKHGELPKSNIEFWKNKLDKNAKRDREVNHALKGEGWTVIRIWEHDIKLDLKSALDKITKVVDSKPTGR
jgi:DNA mismatch endonuclease (patch repair protein)